MLRFLQERVNKATKEFDGKPAEQKVAEVAKAETELITCVRTNVM